MNRRERLMNTLAGKTVDRPAVSFYELNGLTEDPADTDPFNIYSDPSWKPLLDLTREKTDRMVMCHVPLVDAPVKPIDEATTIETRLEEGSKFITRTIKAGSVELVKKDRKDPDVNTTWHLARPLKSKEDLEAYLAIPEGDIGGTPDISRVLEIEEELGDTGIVLIDVADPLCKAAELFDLAEYTITAMMEQELFHRLMQRFAREVQYYAEAVSKALPGRLWRIVGPEYASPPYLPPTLFKEYVTDYDIPLVAAIQDQGGYARIHSHGKLKDVLDHIAATGCDGLDPIEPPEQGDVELGYVREKYGDQLVLFGNLEVSDIETMPTELFREKISMAIEQGTEGDGRGFVLMPSACPYGRKLADLTLRNYETIVEQIDAL